MDDTVEVSTRITATPEHVYALVSDLTRMGEWSPENTGGQWLGAATGPVIGARFKGSNKNGSRKWQTTCTIIVAEPGRELAWESRAFGQPVAVWRYRFAPDGVNATLVTESMEDRRGKLFRVLGNTATGVKDRASHNAESMRVTLERLKRAVEGVDA
jgi:uncharacterized protein YndB with AHSA1/START domain